MSVRRYTRQVRLPEIGEAGQGRLLAAEVRLAATTPFAREVEARYLRAAGITAITEGGAPVDAAALTLRHPAAVEVGEGAYAALTALRRALAIA